MQNSPIIAADELAAVIDDCVLVDCRHDLTHPEAGPAAYAAGHLPGAFFLHQDHDLAGPKTGRNGRHPLPDRAALAARLRSLGLNRGQLLVAYDGSGGTYAGRVWWLARWLGHANVRVLDGGIDAWTRAGYPLSTESPRANPGGFEPGEPLVRAVAVDEVVANLASKEFVILDARAPERFRGEAEPIDPVAGHIPGALNHPLALNTRPDGRFKPPQVLRAEFEAFLAGRDPSRVVHQCGSGVSACQNIVAMEYAGLPSGALYAGSWSEWCADPSRPVATGTD